MFTPSQVIKFCNQRWGINQIMYVTDDLVKFIPVYMAADYIYQHCMEEESKTILYQVTKAVIQWYEKMDPRYCLGNSNNTHNGYLLPVSGNTFHMLTESGFTVKTDCYTEQKHKQLFKDENLYTQFLKP